MAAAAKEGVPGGSALEEVRGSVVTCPSRISTRMSSVPDFPLAVASPLAKTSLQNRIDPEAMGSGQGQEGGTT